MPDPQRATYVDSQGNTRYKDSGADVNPPVDSVADAKADSLNAPIPKSTVPFDQRYGDATGQLGADALRQKSALAQKDDAATGELIYRRAKAEQKYLKGAEDAINSPRPPLPTYEKIKNEPNPEDYHKYSVEFASASALLGAIAGKWTRAGGTASLNAFAGAMQGWQKGNLQAYEEASKQWEQASKKTIDNNNIELAKYKAILEDRKMNIDEKLHGLTIAGYESQNSVIVGMGKDGNFNGIAQAVDKMAMANQRYGAAVDQLSVVRKDQSADFAAQIDTLNANPALAQRIMQDKPLEYAKLKASGETMRHPLNDPAQGTEPLAKVSGTPRSLPAMWAKSFTEDFQRQHGRPPSPDELAAGAANFQGGQSAARAAGTRAGQIEVSVAEADQTFKLAVEASDAVPRGKFVPMNRIILGGKQLMSDPAYRQFIDSNEAAVTAYGATMSRNGANTVAAQTRAHTVLDTADSPQAYRAGIAQLRREVDAVEQAPGQAKRKLLENYFGSSGADTGAAPAGSSDDGYGEMTVH